MAADTRPAWSLRLAAERTARGWTQQQTIDVLRMHSPQPLPDDTNLLRMWKNWESGKHRPRRDYQRVIASAFGSVSTAIFGPDTAEPTRRTESDLLIPVGDTIDLVERIRRSDIDRASLDTLTITVERLCSEYSYMPSLDLRREGQAWLGKLVQLLDQRLTLAEHREVLVLAGWLALLVGCVEYDVTLPRRRGDSTSCGQPRPRSGPWRHHGLGSGNDVLVRAHTGSVSTGCRGSPSRA